MEFEELKQVRSREGLGWGGGGTPCDEVYQRARKSVILVCKKAQKANRCLFWLWESQENILVF